MSASRAEAPGPVGRSPWAIRYCGITQHGGRRSQQDALVAGGTVAVRAGARLSAAIALEAGDCELFAVVDGMGGPAGGESAAAIVATELARPRAATLAADVGGTLEAISDKVAQAGKAWATPSMGATAVLLLIRWNRVVVANVGDCRCYQAADGYLGQLSVDDHDPATAANLVSQSLGGEPRVIDPHELVVPHADNPPTRYLLCSDGVHGSVPATTIRAILLSARDPAEAVDRLDDAARATSNDNYSALVIDVDADARGMTPVAMTGR